MSASEYGWVHRLQKKLETNLEPHVPFHKKASVESDTYHKIDAIRRYMNLKSKTMVLELGCGNGEFTYHINRHCKVIGIDSSRSPLIRNPVRKTALMNPLELAFEDESFDLVFSRQVLSQVEDVDRAVEEMKRVVKRLIVMSEPNRNHPLNLFTGLRPNKINRLKFSPGFLKRLALKHGLKIHEVSIYGILVPALTPRLLLPALRMTRVNQPFGYESLLVAEKPTGN